MNTLVLQTEEGPLEIPRPNLTGDDVAFVRYDESGNITSYGNMHRDHIKKEVDQGGTIIEHDVTDISLSDHKVDVAKKKVIKSARKTDKDAGENFRLGNIRNAIVGALASTDKYFLADSQENITQQEQDQWREFRKQLRIAAKISDPDKMLSAIPMTPKGDDMVSYLRPNRTIVGI